MIKLLVYEINLSNICGKKKNYVVCKIFIK